MGNQYQEIKPKPVNYAGQHFRSTLEARWAVLFDELELWWKYEPERFDFDSGLVYVPDFKLKNGKPIYVEIKPSVIDSVAIVKASKLARTQNVWVLMCMGDFWSGYEIWRFDEDGILEFDYKFKLCKKCDTIWLRQNKDNACPTCGEDMRLNLLIHELVAKNYKFSRN